MSAEKFGGSATEQSQKPKRVAKTSTPIGKNPEHKPEGKRVAIVDEEHERTIYVRYSSLVFRPGERLTDPRKLQLAIDNGISIRYKDV